MDGPQPINHRHEDFQGSAPVSEKIPGVLGMQSGLNSFSMAVGVMEKALYSSYIPIEFSCH